ncbi:YhfG family protein [[Erwinia] mediterraneensis]|uniref:YhfG family protein n=1 Tax=[Erwinia] mediterraneensis TaxID=2161819 RepID=UPI0010327AD2|nr:YhfG family protein [[Erwinia] mediterraneensis]
MTGKLTEKQKSTLWQQRRSASYQASCRLEGLMLAEPVLSSSEQAAERLASLRRQYGR